MRTIPSLVLFPLLAACATAVPVADGGGGAGEAPAPVETAASQRTRVLSATDATRLKQNTGITLQWIGWDERGQADVTEEGGTYRISARQAGPRGGLVTVDGVLSEIGPDYFVLDGAISISDTPDAGRKCFADKTWRFEVTQGRRYYRLREFEWCDGLTDYIDIYF